MWHKEIVPALLPDGMLVDFPIIIVPNSDREALAKEIEMISTRVSSTLLRESLQYTADWIRTVAPDDPGEFSIG